jgi:hypothetical protein
MPDQRVDGVEPELPVLRGHPDRQEFSGQQVWLEVEPDCAAEVRCHSRLGYEKVVQGIAMMSREYSSTRASAPGSTSTPT